MKIDQNCTHIIFLDDLENLTIKKDSTLQLASTLKELGRKVFLIFEEDFFYHNAEKIELSCFEFDFEFASSYGSLETFSLTKKINIQIDENSVLHMRLDPPFDARYMRYLWMLRGLKKQFGCQVINDPEGILCHNEKMVAYESHEELTSFVGHSLNGFINFVERVKKQNNSPYEGLILKPLDLYQGIGVEKISTEATIEELKKSFLRKREEFGGPVVVQPYFSSVEKGEIRAIYFKGIELGSILKIPNKGDFLSNIARGATFEKTELSSSTRKQCEDMAKSLSEKGVPWVAYDILGEKIQEANLTCPGLLVEVSKAMGKNLAYDLIQILEN